jgi:23S rRNA G2445 N2-methylase RlmL
VRIAPTLTSLAEVAARHIDPDLRAMLFPKEASFKAEGDVLALRADGTPVEETEERKLPLAQELVEEVGGWGHKELGLRVDLMRPDIVIYALATASGIDIGVDVVGQPLAKREYRIMLSSHSLKATVAAAAVLYAGAMADDAILDPFVDDGTICVEAAMLLSRTSPRKFQPRFAFQAFPGLAETDWKAWRVAQDAAALPAGERHITGFATTMREMKAVRTNSKLAGVDDHILSTRVSVDWLDAKRAEGSVDRIITLPVVSGKAVTPKEAAKLQDLLFYQAAYALTKKGTVTCVTEKPDELLPHAERHGFSLAMRRDVLMGKRRMAIVQWKR